MMEIEKVTYYVLREPEDEEPRGMFRALHVRNSGRYFELLNARGEWVRKNTLIDYFMGEPGAQEISEKEAEEILHYWKIASVRP